MLPLQENSSLSSLSPSFKKALIDLPTRTSSHFCTTCRKDHPPSVDCVSNTVTLLLNSSFCSTSANACPESDVILTVLSASTFLVSTEFEIVPDTLHAQRIAERMNLSAKAESRNYHFNRVDSNTEEVPGVIKQPQTTDFFSRKDTGFLRATAFHTYTQRGRVLSCPRWPTHNFPVGTVGPRSMTDTLPWLCQWFSILGLILWFPFSRKADLCHTERLRAWPQV